MVTVVRYALRVGVVLACLSGAGVGVAAPARAAAAGFATELSGLPTEFTAGDGVQTVSAVVSRRDGGCVKVRWSMVLTVQGLRLDQVKMDRIEETGLFPLEIRTQGSTARLTDRQLDPGTLCPGRTVTARYRVAFAEDVSRGRVTLAAEAYDAQSRLLARQAATREVIGTEVEATPTAAPTDEPSADPTDEPLEPAGVDDEVEPSEEVVAEVPPAASGGRPVSSSGGFGVVQAAFLLGALLLSLGVGLLLRLRQLTKTAEAAEPAVGLDFERAAPPQRGWGLLRR
ncbi:hypothetical protein GA0070558_14525 [Micromonospora haikouensis]|uniref:Uncharacterized protein n=1 Tax=Micromonospora haikouensis TaxID=686309 RepID=A0A1C4YFZ0_9ACTN|nr:hypothetical protein [Micromonospora haikouensis]SCF19633.1 hypothetical protein GA0070558_14525 [Micromonospora haikouensis]